MYLLHSRCCNPCRMRYNLSPLNVSTRCSGALLAAALSFTLGTSPLSHNPRSGGCGAGCPCVTAHTEGLAALVRAGGPALLFTWFVFGLTAVAVLEVNPDLS